MHDSYLILTPVLVLLLASLVGFVGCAAVWDLEEVPPQIPPANVVATPGNREVVLTWSKPANGNPDGYRVTRSDTMGGSHTTIGDVTNTTFTDPMLTNGTTYYYKVISLVGGTVRGSSEEIPATPMSPGIEFVDSFTPGTLRSNYTGWVGMKITVGVTALDVLSLGRAYIPNNAGTHNLKIVDEMTGADVPGSLQSVTMMPGAAGEIQYVPLPTPVTLTAGRSYFVLSSETNGGDQFYDFDTQIMTTGVALVTNAAFSDNSINFAVIGAANNCFGPVSFTY